MANMTWYHNILPVSIKVYYCYSVLLHVFITDEIAEVIQVHTAVEDDELTLIGGQKVKVTKRDNSGWWKGEVEGKRGMFPGHCVRLIKEDEKIKQVNTTCIKEGRGQGRRGMFTV